MATRRTAPHPEVRTGRGVVVGEAADGVSVFRGIPYAEPPVGPLRLRPPRPAPAWEGSRPALSFGPACPQGGGAPPGGGAGAGGAGARPPVFGGLFGPGAHGTSEDCLTLNVWTPSAGGGARPVMVFVHGGAFRLGSGTAPTYDGSALARRGDVVVVTLNYRLGVLGFLHLPELGAVNLGLQDQVAALRWVAEEIAAFGGDPAAVTVFGESAGAKSIECLMAMPAARGLFRGAILQSTYAPGMDAGPAAAFAGSVVEVAGARRPEGLRDLSTDALLSAAVEAQTSSGANLFGGLLGPVVDGEILPDEPIRSGAAGATAPVPLIVGTTRDEARLFGALAPGGLDIDEDALLARLEVVLAGGRGPALPAGDVAAAYRRVRSRRGQGTSPADVVMAVQTDRMFRQHSIALAETHGATQPDVWMYLFTWPSTAFGGALGACHALELPFVFGTLEGPTSTLTGVGEAADHLSEVMQDAWIRFAREGAPGTPDGVDWPRYEPGDRLTLELGRRVEVLLAPEEEERLLWSELTADAS
ncbi:MAG TPA: carboxylesterase/lipase family protein [Acidimicrobiales bacterium]|nr:carboxylesterase/lipase family protein [Acidimicrobiales bacterium]